MTSSIQPYVLDRYASWKPKVVMVPNFSPLVALEVVIMTTSSASSNNKVGILTTLGVFQCCDCCLLTERRDTETVQTSYSHVSPIPPFRVLMHLKMANLRPLCTLITFVIFNDLQVWDLTFWYSVNVICADVYIRRTWELWQSCWLPASPTRAPSQYKDRLIYVWRFPC